MIKKVKDSFTKPAALLIAVLGFILSIVLETHIPFEVGVLCATGVWTNREYQKRKNGQGNTE